MQHRAFLEAIRQETLGFSIGEPWRVGETSIACILPILRDNQDIPAYVLSEGGELEITDTGSISSAKIRNLSDKPLFMRLGEAIKGLTQARTLVSSWIIQPKGELIVPVRCIHASHPISFGAEMKSNGYVPGRESVYLNATHYGQMAGQQTSWTSDRSYTGMAAEGIAARAEGTGLPSGSHDGNAAYSTPYTSPLQAAPDDLLKARDNYSEVFQDVLSKVPLLDTQIGMAVIDMQGFSSLDAFDLHLSWRAVREAMVTKEALNITKESDLSAWEFRSERVKALVKDVLSKGFEERLQYEDDRARVLTLQYKGFIGEVVELDEEIIHLFIGRE